MGRMYTVRLPDGHMSQIIRCLAEQPYRDVAPIILGLTAQMKQQAPDEVPSSEEPHDAPRAET